MNWKTNAITNTLYCHASACGCIGPQNGEPLCPCKMRGVKIVDGRYVRVEDLGPAPGQPTGYETCFFDHLNMDPGKVTGIACPCPKCSPR